MNDLSPSSQRSGDSMKYSESFYTRETQFLRDNKEYIMTSSLRPNSDSMIEEEEKKEMHQTATHAFHTLNSDLADDCNFYPEEVVEEHKITDSDGSIKFVISDTQIGKVKRDL